MKSSNLFFLICFAAAASLIGSARAVKAKENSADCVDSIFHYPAQERINNDLIWYAEHRDLKGVESSLTKGTDINARVCLGGYPSNGATALIYSSQGGYIAITQFLLDHGADANIKDRQQGATALMYASAQGQTSIDQILLEHGAKINTADNTGYTALMFAVAADHVDTARFLVEHGANADLKDAKGQTAMDLAGKNAALKNAIAGN
ncbi:MAG: ankyrin repeat domain-containing protein [Elusimicrobiota bacterium]